MKPKSNDTLIVTRELKAAKPGEFIEKRYSLPAEVLALAKDNRVTIKFVAKIWLAAVVFDMRLLHPNAPTAPQAR